MIPSPARVSPLLRITAALDLLDQRACVRPPFEVRPRALGAHATVRAHGIVGQSLAPFCCRLLHSHALCAATLPEHAADRFAHLAHGILAVLGVIELAVRRL